MPGRDGYRIQVKPVDLVGISVEVTSGTPALVLREHDAPHRLLPMFIGELEAASIAMAVSGIESERPLTHDLVAALMRDLGVHLRAVEVTELRDGAFIAELALISAAGEQRFDTRPSDGVALAVRLGAPVLVSEAVLAEAGTVPPDEPSTETIDEEVREFREVLDRVNPSDFT